MCGIAGIHAFQETVDALKLASAGSILAHRGPDDSGAFVDPSGVAGLSHRRLSIIDLSEAGHQPMVIDESAGVVAIAYNGEVYNFEALRAECAAAMERTRGLPIRWRGYSDTEVLLWGYVLFGVDFLSRLDGMFAVAIWDGRTKRMVVARDRFGVKPLYYSISGDGLIFASELKALMRLRTRPAEVDPIAVAQYVSFLYTPGSRTMLQDVRKLGPGEFLITSSRGLERHERFVREIPAAAEEEMSPSTAVKRTRELLDAAVRRQMIADVRVGAFLSGGLDSTSIVALARQYATSRLQCFTIGHKGDDVAQEGWASDLPYAERAARHLDVDLHTVWVGTEMVERFGWMIGQLDEPQADPAALNAYFICDLARSMGVKVLLSGAGGDDLFSGYRRHRALALEKWWDWLPHPARVGLSEAARLLPPSSAWGRRLRKVLRHAGAPADERIARYFLWLEPGEGQALWGDAGRSVPQTEDVLRPMREKLTAAAQLDPLARMLLLDRSFFLVDHNLNYTDKMSMAASVEVRVPFLDNDLADFSDRIPAGLKQHGPIGKWVLKQAMRGVIPDALIDRPKTGFAVPLRAWMRGGLRPLLEDTLSPSVVRRRGLFKPAGVAQLRARHETGQVDAAYPLLALSCVELWCRNFIDKTP